MKYWFQIVVVVVCLSFFGVMAFVTYTAFSHQSGKTGMDMGKVQQMRYVAENH